MRFLVQCFVICAMYEVRFIVTATMSLIADNEKLKVAMVKTHESTFYIITVNSIICNFLALLADFVLAIPMIYFGYNINSRDKSTISVIVPYPISYVLGAFFDVYGVGDMLFGILLALNRAFIFLTPALDHICFRGRRIYFSISFVWILTVGIVALYEITGCGFHLNVVEDFCKPNPSAVNIFVRQFGYVYMTKYGPFVMLTIYLCIYVKLKTQSNGSAGVTVTQSNLLKHVSRRERRFLIQCFVICAMYEIRFTARFTAQTIALIADNEKLKVVMMFVKNCIMFGLTASNAFILFMFNAEMRNFVLKKV
ncbi:serpentine type 7TM GPCR chemoreceptor srx domain-containing protein [Ditylenchus destructor]|nr:serpentine type 7TM GPCR chemoreceptor srx domain-containing protein [Ditylenchus destructor]